MRSVSLCPMETMREDPLDEIRAAVAARIEATSLRGAARELQMSPEGLRKFVRGAQPYSATLLRLRAWYGDDDAARQINEIVAAFLGLLAPQKRAAAIPVIREWLGEVVEA